MNLLRRNILFLSVALLVGGARGAHAQDVALPEPIEPEANSSPEVAVDVNLDIDLSNVVTSAAKGLTTVQEAPAITTVITGDDIQRRGFRFLDDALATVPGWMDSAIIGGALPLPMVRGVQQAALLLRDGVSMHEPWANWPAFNRSVPLETIKRIEIVTGPGGVLWGANSFLGIVSVLSKDADDVNGLEVSAGYGDGPGNKQDFRTYAMFGKSFLNNRLKIFQHISFESYLGPEWDSPAVIVPWNFAQRYSPDPERSWILDIDGRYSYGPVTLYYSVPLGTMSSQITYIGPTAHGHVTVYDRYGILEYKQRFFKDRFSINAKAYYTQFVRDNSPGLLPTSTVFPPFTDPKGQYNPGGFVLDASGTLSQRFGGTVDTDLTLPYRLRLLTGLEVFNESASRSNESYASPQNPGYFGFPCPVNADGTLIAHCPLPVTYDTDRTVWAAYVDGQWHPHRTLIFDAGVRLQQALGRRPYALTPLYSASAVWNFIPAYHLKFNYATGFRSPVFINTDSGSSGFNWAGNPNLRNENSQALQGELNGRVARNVGVFREIEARAGYAYTVLDNLIETQGTLLASSFKNSGKRASHSVEAQMRIYLVGDHFVELGYTYLYSISSTFGYLRNSPSQWFTFTTSLNIIKHMLDINANLRVYSAAEDSNRFASSAASVPGATSSAGDTNATFDRLSPVAIVQLGAHLSLLHGRLGVNAQVYNALNQHYWLPDAINELRPNQQSQPIAAPGISFFSSISYRFF